ncbi:MAG TPA: glutathione S-transferase N-terminal domain-containing protein [Acetobacteraceae bacterium]|nr:glutathione S-transferase N-terminal domain-containing protein [Acetobacteraceae bacterium]
MKLMYSPGACSIGIHVLLEEIGKPYEAQLVNLREGGQFKPEFTSVNPKSKVPTLVRDDGSVLTEYPAIAYWLARTNPDKKLLPDDVDAQTRVLEALDYAVSTVHMQGFQRLFRAANYTPNPADEDKVKERGKELVEKGFAVLDKALDGKDYLAGSFSIADSALFYVEFWGGKRMNMKLPPNCEAHLNRMLARPAVQRVLQQEGLN